MLQFCRASVLPKKLLSTYPSPITQCSHPGIRPLSPDMGRMHACMTQQTKARLSFLLYFHSSPLQFFTCTLFKLLNGISFLQKITLKII